MEDRCSWCDVEIDATVDEDEYGWEPEQDGRRSFRRVYQCGSCGHDYVLTAEMVNGEITHSAVRPGDWLDRAGYGGTA